MIKTNWAEEAAIEIDILVDVGRQDTTGNHGYSINDIRYIIERHCPFKQDTLYEEVTETSRKLDEINSKLDKLEPMIKHIRGQM